MRTHLQIRTLSFLELTDQLKISGPPADPLFGASWATTTAPWRLASWRLPVVNGLAVLAIIGAIAYRLWEANLPTYVVRTEAAIIGSATVLAVVGVSIRASRLAACGSYSRPSGTSRRSARAFRFTRSAISTCRCRGVNPRPGEAIAGSP